MSSNTFYTVAYTHRFAGPCRAKDLQPYARPDILSIQATYEDGTLENIPHAILRLGYGSKGRISLEMKSERDEDFYGNWSGSSTEFDTIFHSDSRELRLWNLTFRLSSRMTRILLDARNPAPV
jgi:hypothetical protein